MANRYELPIAIKKSRIKTMPKVLKKIFLSILVFLVVFTSSLSLFVAASHAETDPPPPPPGATAPQEGAWYNQGFGQWYSKVYDENTSPGNEIFGERYTAAQVQWVVYSLMAFIINGSLGNSSASQAAVSCFLGGAIDVNTCIEPLKALISSLPTPNLAQNTPKNQSLPSLVFAPRPLSGIGYVRERIDKFNLVPEARAATSGFGFGALEPIQDMWRGARDIAFGLFILAAIILAFMIMFRVKISPQVVISIQSAIPKLIIALVLVTFSYAIAGLMIDLMYIVIGLISLLAPNLTIFKIDATYLFNFLTSSNILGLLTIYVFSLVISFIALTAMVMGAPLFAVATAVLTVILWWLFIGLLLAVVVVAIVLSVKILWSLLRAFATVILLVVFGPLQIVLGVVIPSLGFGQWLKNIIANLSIFVLTGVLLLFSFVFLINGVILGLEEFYGAAPGGDIDLGNVILHFIFGSGATIIQGAAHSTSGYWPPLFSGVNGITDFKAITGLLFLGVSFVLFTLIPKANEIIQGLITGKPFAYGTAVGEAIGLGANVWKGKTASEVSDYEKNFGPSKRGTVLRSIGFIKK